MTKTGHILNGRCSNCRYKIVRAYKENPSMTYYAMNLIQDGKKIKGVCGNCKAEITLSPTMFTKYVVRVLKAGEKQ